ncbi:FGGY-family carbohydrate kinase [Waterburya agarophytonicola K14]|uniref:D-ribulose kinase n=1 Tax=Waterburya agarophytonicola KI4 TaxID=2874699 RepID=A0A964BND8_9CYAN|nr:FGGY-family carbohydrate kinase [Waterburya agarophytonicola]MCC0176445.1 FGGY-family carbohydrate kinase [Waterburya agarophytonicola KI4]
MTNNYYLGIDFGTSGARAIAIDKEKNIVATKQNSFTNITADELTQTWQDTLYQLIAEIPLDIRKQLQAIAINGTSSTVLLCDREGKAIAPPILYDDARGKEELEQINNIAPDNHVVVSATSSLAKLLWWQKQPYFKRASYFLHQADWLGYLLHGKLGISDYHNALKLGYDVEHLSYPIWLQKQPYSHLYPQVFTPGAVIGNLTPQQSHRFNLPANCIVRAGTTDSIAAFLASGVSQPGEAVTSLGSTLVLKLLSQTKINSALYGIYSHRIGKLWLAGGASNTGGAVLRHFFNDEQLQNLSQHIDPKTRSSLEYYPLLKPGDRFPLNDPDLAPRLSPRPTNSSDFLQGLLEGISRIEALGYQKLQELGADKLTQVYSAGGGAKNSTWQAIRQGYLNVLVTVAANTQAAYGTALLAANQTLL